MVTTMIGRGLYAPKQVACLANLKLETSFSAEHFRRWARGYESAGRSYAPVIIPEIEDDRDRITFVEFIELLFVASYRSLGISPQVIRAAAHEGARLFETKHPFAVTRFRTDGKSIFAELERVGAARLGIPEELLVEDLPRAQMVFAEMVEPYFRDIDWGELEAQAYWPCGRDGRIVLDPRRCYGQPIDAATGVATDALYSFVASGDAPETVAEWYEVPVAAVNAAVQFERALRESCGS